MTQIPTIQELYNAIVADIQTELGIMIPATGKSFLRAMAAVQAAKLKQYYLAIGALQKNLFVDTADRESSGGTLERFGRVKIGRNPYPAVPGEYEVEITGTVGATIPAGTTFISDDTTAHPGMLFVLDSAFTLASGTDTLALRALTPGTGGELSIGDTLTATAPLSNVDEAAVVTAELVAAIDAEDIEDYRRVVLTSFRLYPQGGASADYRIWGLDTAGVKQVYPYAASGAPNEINVFVEATIGASTDGMGTPSGTILGDVADNIETDPITGAGRRPLGVFAVNVAAVIINKIDITISGAANISTANRALIDAALEEAVNAVRPFIAGADTLAERNDVFGTNNIISTILSTVPGAIFSSATMTVQIGAGPMTPTVSKTFDQGNIPYLTSVTYA